MSERARGLGLRALRAAAGRALRSRRRLLALVHGPPERLTGRPRSDDNLLTLLAYLRRQAPQLDLSCLPISAGASVRQARERAWRLRTSGLVVTGEIDDMRRYRPDQRVLTLGYFTPFKAEYRQERFAREKYGAAYEELIWSERDFRGLDYAYAATSAYAADALARGYGIPRERFALLGFPRHDLLLEPRPPVPLRALFGLEREPRQLLLYAPTFRDRDVFGLEDPDPERARHPLGLPGLERELAELLARHEALLVIKLHRYYPLYRELEARLAGPGGRWFPGCHFLTAGQEEQAGITVYDLFRQSSALVTDYSSIAFDYLFVDRPLIHWVYDQEEYARYRGFAHEPVEELMAGPRPRDASALLAALEDVLAGRDEHAAARAALHARVHEVRDGSARARVTSYLLSP